MSSEHKPKKETKTNVAHPSLGNSQKAPFIREIRELKKKIRFICKETSEQDSAKNYSQI